MPLPSKSDRTLARTHNNISSEFGDPILAILGKRKPAKIIDRANRVVFWRDYYIKVLVDDPALPSDFNCRVAIYKAISIVDVGRRNTLSAFINMKEIFACSGGGDAIIETIGFIELQRDHHFPRFVDVPYLSATGLHNRSQPIGEIPSLGVLWRNYRYTRSVDKPVFPIAVCYFRSAIFEPRPGNKRNSKSRPSRRMNIRQFMILTNGGESF